MNVISGTLRDILNFVDGFIGNYGWSVVAFTLLIRLVLLPLDIKSKKSMRRMSKLKPQMDAIQKKYANDKEKLAQKQSELYKRAGVSPLSGCLPMLIQLPILFCMFTAMRVVANEKTVEMLLNMIALSKQDGFSSMTITNQLLADNGINLQGWLWIKNVFQPDAFWSTVIPHMQDTLPGLGAVNGISLLSQENIDAVRAFLSTDEYLRFADFFGATKTVYSAPMLFTTINIPEMFNGLFILPILAGGSQLLSTKLLGADQGGDATTNQTSKMMNYFFPIFSIWICSTSTAAFSIYWVAVNVIQIVSQLLVNMYFNKKDAQTDDSQEVIQP